MVIPFAGATGGTSFRRSSLRGLADRPCLVHRRCVRNAFDQAEDSPDLHPLPPPDRNVQSAQENSAKNDDRQRESPTGNQGTPADESDRGGGGEEHDRIARLKDVPSFDMDRTRAA